MRLVKKSVNQDDPGTYHLFYADADGHPGTDLTFFPWAQMAPSRDGYGLSSEVSLAVPPGSLDFWSERLQQHGVAVGPLESRFGQPALALRDSMGYEWRWSKIRIRQADRLLRGTRVRFRSNTKFEAWKARVWSSVIWSAPRRF